jgi:hypothetical protein
MPHGRTLKLFLVDGAPQGLLTAEIMNWSGHVITAPRSKLNDLVLRPESKRTGVYVLVGPEQHGIGTQVYVGETDDLADRLKQHNRPEGVPGGGKDFWERVCIISSKDTNLTKSHAKYLESRLLTIATNAGRCTTINRTDPQYDRLPEPDTADMEFFLEQIQTLMPVLGFDFFRETPLTQSMGALPNELAEVPSVSPIFRGDVRLHGIVARAQEINGEFVVLAGSMARLRWEGVETNYTRLFNELSASGVLVPAPDGLHNVFKKNYAFASPSAAAAVVAGRNANGRRHWVVEGTETNYGDWQAETLERLEEMTPPAGPAPSPEL